MQSYRDAPARRSAPGATDAARGDALTGRLLDRRYRIGARVARGGMASVYEAVDTRLDRLVAVKIMHPGMGDDDEFAARFVREAHSAARLSHPNVVAVFDQGDDEGIVFLAMEYVPGHTLRDVIRRESPMTPARALALVEPIASALAAAHRAGLIHRDVKPENVLIEDTASGGRVKVADFGLAKAISADTQHTVTGGVLIGTVSYLAPELVVDGRADARADVYATGVVLYEMLTGHKPHEGESPIAVAYKHVHTDVPAPSAAVPGIPAYVDALVARATSRDRSQRPADAGVLLHQIHRVAQALREGVREDPELFADLVPRPPVPDDNGLEHTRPVSTDTAPEPFDPIALANCRADERAPERALSRSAPGGVITPSGVLVRESSIDRPAPSAPAPPRTVVRGGRQRRSRRGPILLVLALLLAAAGGVGAYWFGVVRYTTTPGVIGLAESAAVDRVEAAGLAAEAGDPAYSETVPAGEVLATVPDAGSPILDAGIVTLRLSLGKERYDVPSMAGSTEDQAQDALRETSLSFGRSLERFSQTVAAGTVIRSDPSAGKTLRPGAAVDLVVSKGKRPIQVKDWTGEEADEAEQVMGERGLVVERAAEEYDDEVPAGHVLSQTPVSGTLFRGETVQLVVSRGPELVEIPSGLVAMGVEAAEEQLAALGFDVRVEEGSSYLGLGFVMDVDPGSGTMLPKGSTVTLYLV